MEATAARRKAEMELKKAEIKADLTLLESRRIAVVAQTEARILEEDGSQTGAASQDQRSQLPEEEADPFQRVQDYVEEQSLSLTNQDAIANDDNAHFDVHMDNFIGWNTRVINPHPMVTNTPSVVYGPPEVTSTPFSTRHPASKTRPVTFELSENAPDFVPSHQRPPYEVSTPNLITESVNDPATVDQTSEITRFLLHKEILLSGLTNFNDRAESYYVWKNSFKSVIDEAKVSDSQQLNLLVIANKTGIERGQEKPGRYTRGTLLRCPESERELDRCIIHKTKHSLDDCRGFRSKSIDERKELLKQNNICYKCCASNKHRSRKCTETISCKDCGSKQHTTALHVTRSKQPSSTVPMQKNGGETNAVSNPTTVNTVNASCTEICGYKNTSK